MQGVTTQESRADVHGLAPNQPAAAAAEAPTWGSCLQAEVAAAGLDLPAGSSSILPAPAPTHTTCAQVASQGPALVQAPGPGQGTALPHHRAPAPASVPVQGLISGPAPSSAPPLTLQPADGGRSMVSSILDPLEVAAPCPSAYCAPAQPSSLAPGVGPAAAGQGTQPVPAQLATAESPIPASGPLPPHQSAGTQTIPPAPDAALVATQRNIDPASASAALQTEPAVEVEIRLLIWDSQNQESIACSHLCNSTVFHSS